MNTHIWHFIGIGGIGMSGLARILLERGAAVSGSDVSGNARTAELQQLGARIHIGHHADNVPKGAQVVYSSAITADNTEYQQAQNLNCALLHRSELLTKLAEGHTLWGVTGTHGKTTTSALLASVLHDAGKDPSFAIGGIVKNFRSQGHAGEGADFVIEADESDGTFLNYHCDAAIITNIGGDHLDEFGSVRKQEDAFRQFAQQIKNPQQLVWCGDDRQLSAMRLPGTSYGFGRDCSAQLSQPRHHGWITTVDLSLDGARYADIEIPLLGGHNALNAAAVFTLGLKAGITEEVLRTALANFRGVGRRCDVRSTNGGITVVDDYAHHAVELGASLASLRAAEPTRRIIALFQPHRYTRTLACLGQYGQAFSCADMVIVTDVYTAGEQPIPGADSVAIIQELEADHIPCRFVSRSELGKSARELATPGDMLVTLGAGDITAVAQELSQAFASSSTSVPTGL